MSLKTIPVEADVEPMVIKQHIDKYHEYINEKLSKLLSMELMDSTFELTEMINEINKYIQYIPWNVVSYLGKGKTTPILSIIKFGNIKVITFILIFSGKILIMII